MECYTLTHYMMELADYLPVSQEEVAECTRLQEREEARYFIHTMYRIESKNVALNRTIITCKEKNAHVCRA